MAKIRVQDIAAEFDMKPQVVMKKLEEIGIFAPSPMTPLKPEEVIKIKSIITGKKIKLVKKKVAKPGEEEPKEPKEVKEVKEAPEVKEEAPVQAKETEKPSEKPAEKPAEAPAKEQKGAESAPAPKPVSKAPGGAAPSRRAPEERRSVPSGDRAAQRPSGTGRTNQGVRPDGSTFSGRSFDGRPARPAGSRPGQSGSGAPGRAPGSGRPGSDRPGERRDGQRPGGARPAGGPRAAGSSGPSKDSFDMGAGRTDRKTDRAGGGKAARRGQDSKKNADRQKSTGSEEYKAKKKSLAQEANFLDDDSLARHKKKPVKRPQQSAEVVEDDIKIVQLPDSMTVKEFAELLHKPMNTIIKALMGKGIMAGLNQIIEFDQAEELATEMDILVEHLEEEDIFAKFTSFEDPEESLRPRSPVVVVMGHVDHGKTSLLDAIRDTNVTSREAGGITQHIGASVVSIDGRSITFLDTPGHEAFTAMRMRGAMVTDIAILVVAADDGVMPQTIEAINHAKAAGVQIIVAINKMDKPGANPDRVKQELTEYGLIAEEWGGSTICVPVSAMEKTGIDTLLEMVLLTADMQELKANPDALASGTVIESELDKGRGAVATVLVQRGTLHVGDTIVAGSAFGRIKAMVDDTGRRVKEAGPSVPVEVIGLGEVPSAGDPFYMTETDREARMLAEKVSARERMKLIDGNKKVNLTDLFGDIEAGEVKELNILVKADVQGSVEAVRQSLEKLSNEKVQVKVIHGAVGAVTESDVMLASASNSIIIGFNVRPEASAKSMADEQKVDIRLYRVIYNAIDDIEAAMKGLLDPEFEEKVVGHAEVRQIFHASGVGTIAGSYVTDGKIQRNLSARLVRDGIVIHEGPLSSLRRFKDDVREVATGYECGIMFEKYSDIKEGDVIEAFTMEEIKRS